MEPKIIFCTSCKEKTKHGDVGILPRLKCFSCGEYNLPQLVDEVKELKIEMRTARNETEEDDL